MCHAPSRNLFIGIDNSLFLIYNSGIIISVFIPNDSKKTRTQKPAILYFVKNRKGVLFDMIGSKLKKYAGQIGLQVSGNMVYGEYRGYIMSICRVSGRICVGIAAAMPNEAAADAVLNALGQTVDFRKKHHIQSLSVTPRLIEILFPDNAFAMRTLGDAVEFVMNVLHEQNVPGASCCTHCGNEFTSSCTLVKIGNYVFPMHNSCVQLRVEDAEKSVEESRRNGNIGTGIIGAALGGIVGSIPWAVAYYFGWFVGWLGFVIGFAAKKGYEIFKGRESKAKAAVIIIVTFLAVIFAEYATLLFTAWRETVKLSDYNFSLLDIMRLVGYILQEDPTLWAGIIWDIILGWVFAGLGIFSTIRNILSSSPSSAIPVVIESSYYPMKNSDHTYMQ